jgi:hypothetical protein
MDEARLGKILSHGSAAPCPYTRNKKIEQMLFRGALGTRHD